MKRLYSIIQKAVQHPAKKKAFNYSQIMQKKHV